MTYCYDCTEMEKRVAELERQVSEANKSLAVAREFLERSDEISLSDAQSQSERNDNIEWRKALERLRAALVGLDDAKMGSENEVAPEERRLYPTGKTGFEKPANPAGPKCPKCGGQARPTYHQHWMYLMCEKCGTHPWLDEKGEHKPAPEQEKCERCGGKGIVVGCGNHDNCKDIVKCRECNGTDQREG